MHHLLLKSVEKKPAGPASGQIEKLQIGTKSGPNEAQY